MKKLTETPNITHGPWSSSTQKGSPGHCMMAQVFDSKGQSLATIRAEKNPVIATANAKIMSEAPNLIKILIKIWRRMNDELAYLDEHKFLDELEFKELVKEITEIRTYLEKAGVEFIDE